MGGFNNSVLYAQYCYCLYRLSCVTVLDPLIEIRQLELFSVEY